MLSTTAHPTVPLQAGPRPPVPLPLARPRTTPPPAAPPGAAPVPCRTAPADLFFAEEGEPLERARALCATCPCAAACLRGALARREPAGVWGGHLFVDGVPVAYKRRRGRPRKDAPPVTVVL
ncbi:WhiB family transcriptional regulator [Kineococcus terrestris]|uniref:WhiB family transcriptional regulator n=1 Tax=Kineococcus terrestris TaxID=2044856 RepID=UPI0034DAF5AE